MNISKNVVVKEIAQKSSISLGEGLSFLELFLALIKTEARSKVVKFSGFGTFRYKKTPKRIGRNPKTRDSYIIPTLNKLKFNPSNKIKEKIN